LPRIGLTLVLAFVVYGVFLAADSLFERLHRVVLSAQATFVWA
jgi:hypothetical protein